MENSITTNLLGRQAYVDNQTDRSGERGEIITVSHGSGGWLCIGIRYDDGTVEEYVASSNPNFHVCSNDDGEQNSESK